MYNILPLIIISVLLLIIIFILFRRFPALAVLDVDNIPEEREQQIKEKIIRDRIKRKLSFFDRLARRVNGFFDRFFSFLKKKSEKMEEDLKKKREGARLTDVSPEEKINFLFSQAEELIKREEWLEAEKKLIEIIEVDDKNFTAFWELGEVYYSSEKWQEAKQTLLYALKLGREQLENIDKNDLANINYSLALINKNLDNVSEAINHISDSLEVDSNNPRYLDLMVDLCIIKQDKALAYRFLNKIKEVNPDNNNIASWEESIREISD